jgi:VCBS repeat-containing protein
MKINKELIMKMLSTSLVSLIITPLLLLGCGGESQTNSTLAPMQVAEPSLILPNYNLRQDNQSLLARTVLSNSANAAGTFAHPLTNETFNGNLIASIDVTDPDGIQAVALSFNQQPTLKYLCNTSESCGGTSFHQTISSINPKTYGLLRGPITLGLWVLDNQHNQMQVASVTVNWQYRKITGLSISRSTDGTDITANWQKDSALLKYNLYLAAQPNVNKDNYSSLAQGQAILAQDTGPQSFSNLTPSDSYFISITGVDGSGESAFSTEIRMDAPIGSPNTAPVATNDHILAHEDELVTGNLLDNDLDPDGNPLFINTIPVRLPYFGEVTLQQDGSFSYLAPSNFNGEDSFDYEIQDGQGGFAQATVTITIHSTNDAPVAVDDNYVVAVNQMLTVVAPGVLSNDSDLDGDSLSIATEPITNTSHGVLTLVADGGFSYLPSEDYLGLDSFQYQLIDGNGGTAIGTVIINIGGINNPPVANNDSYSTPQNTSLVVDGDNLPSVLANDTDPDGDPLQLHASLISNVSHGSLSISLDGLFTYIPDNNFVGIDSFVYAIEDGRGGNAQATVSIDVTAGNVAPVAVDDAVTLDEDSSVLINVLANDTDADGDPLEIINWQASHGSVSLTDNLLLYQPNANFHGSDIIDYTIYDGNGHTATAQVNVTVTSVNDAPVAQDDSASTSVGNSISINVLVNDSDVDGDSLSVTSASTDMGTVSINSDHSLFFTDGGSTGTATIDYSITDGQGGTASAMVIVTISGSGNSTPIANNDSFTVTAGTTTNFDVLANDSDADNDSLSVTSASGGSGTINILSDNTIDYTPSISSGSDSFSYSISDGQGGSASASVTIIVNAANTNPIANDDSFSVTTGTTTNFDVLANDSDADNDSLSVTSASGGTGTISILSDNTIDYTPSISSGSDSFSYSISDGRGGSASASVTIIVNAANIAPSALPDSYSLRPNTSISVTGTPYPLPVANDTDADEDPFSFNGVMATVEHGSLTDSSDSSFSYIPNTGFAGVDSFLYEIVDPSAAPSRAIVTLSVSELSWSTTHGLPNLPLTNYHGVSYNGTTYFTVADKNILSSADATIWRRQFNDTNSSINAVASGISPLSANTTTNVAVGGANQVWVMQSNGSSGVWAKRSISTTRSLHQVVFNQGEFMATGFGEVLYSLDGIAWTRSATVNAINFYGIVSALNQVVIVGDSGTIETSSTGFNWQVQSSGVSTKLNDVISNNADQVVVLGIASPTELFVAVGDVGTILTSPDGTTWTSRASNTSENLNAITFGNNQYMVVGDNSTVLTSPDGITWTQQTGVDAPSMRDVIFDGTQFMLVGDSATILCTFDGINYFQIAAGDHTNFTSVATNGVLVVRAGNPSNFFWTIDGLNWIQIASAQPFAVNHLDNFNGIFIAVGDKGLVVTSIDGLNWIQQTTPTTSNINDVHFYSGIDPQTGQSFALYAAVGDNGLFMTSNDAMNWTIEQLDTGTLTDNLYGVTHDDDYFVAVGQNGRILVRNNTSTPGGTTWMDFFSNPSFGQLNDVVWDGTTNIIVGAGGTVVTGTAMGGVFTKQSTSFTDNLNSVAFNKGNYIAVGDQGAAFSSSDGKNWLPAISGSSDNLRFVVIDNSIIYAIGDNGAVMVGFDNY